MHYTTFLYSALVTIICNIVIGILIVDKLSKHGEKINYFLIRMLMPKYVGQYRDITRQESGKTGGLFYAWIISIKLTLLLAVSGIILKMV